MNLRFNFFFLSSFVIGSEWQIGVAIESHTGRLQQKKSPISPGELQKGGQFTTTIGYPQMYTYILQVRWTHPYYPTSRVEVSRAYFHWICFVYFFFRVFYFYGCDKKRCTSDNTVIGGDIFNVLRLVKKKTKNKNQRYQNENCVTFEDARWHNSKYVKKTIVWFTLAYIFTWRETSRIHAW